MNVIPSSLRWPFFSPLWDLDVLGCCIMYIKKNADSNKCSKKSDKSKYMQVISYFLPVSYIRDHEENQFLSSSFFFFLFVFSFSDQPVPLPWHRCEWKMSEKKRLNTLPPHKTYYWNEVVASGSGLFPFTFFSHFSNPDSNEEKYNQLKQ